MRKVLLFTGFLFLFIVPAYPQEPENIVTFEDLKFYSYFEEMAFYNFMQGSEDVLMLFAAIDPDVNTNIYEGFKKDMVREMERLDNRKFQRVREEKKISIIYDHVNTQVLTHYREKILFPHIFVNGTFNCLTASAYYGFLMDSLGIEYDFRETYNHVYPVAFPRTMQIKIETTDPIAGVEYYNQKLKRKFVDYLLEKKNMTRDEYYSNSIEELFNRYFLPESGVGLLELAGLQYMNDALYNYDSEEYYTAFEQIKKAYFLYPSDRMRMLFQFILSGALGEAEFLRIEEAELLVYLSRLPDDEINVDEISLGYLYLTERLLFNSSRTDYYDELFRYLYNHMRNGLVKDEISFQYYFHRGKSKLIHYKFREALDLFLKAYELNAHNLELQSLIVTSLANTFDNTPAPQLVENIELYAAEMPVLSENGMFISLQMMSYLILIEQLFDFEEIDSALMYLDKFETLFKRNPEIDIDYEHVGDAYSAAAVYYFKNYQKHKAVEFLERGLEIAPENYELQYRLKSVRNP